MALSPAVVPTQGEVAGKNEEDSGYQGESDFPQFMHDLT
jgi:hypothetical protein